MAESEVRNGHFVYRDTLFAEVGENKRHPRASTVELKELLLLGKNGTPKDQVGHWYEAQLIHYGLPRSKDKNTAKVRLTGALSSSSLVVPAGIQKIELDLKKEYATLIRKAKAATTKAKAVPAIPSVVSKKRKAETSDEPDVPGPSKIKISVKVGDVTIEIDQQNPSNDSKSTKKQKKINPILVPSKTTSKWKAEKTTKITKTISNAATSTSRKSGSAPKTKVKHKVDGVSCYGPEATGVNQWQCETCRLQSHDSFFDSSAKKPSTKAANNLDASKPPRAKQTARRGKPFGSFDNREASGCPSPSQRQPTPMSIDSDNFNEGPPPLYSQNSYSHESSRSNADHNVGNVVQISGSYITDLSRSLGVTNFEVRLSHCQDQMWGRLFIDDKMILVRLDGLNGIESLTRKTFGWRTKNHATGQLRFGKGCDGWIEFDGNGQVGGRFTLLRTERMLSFKASSSMPLMMRPVKREKAKLTSYRLPGMISHAGPTEAGRGCLRSLIEDGHLRASHFRRRLKER